MCWQTDMDDCMTFACLQLIPGRAFKIDHKLFKMEAGNLISTKTVFVKVGLFKVEELWPS